MALYVPPTDESDHKKQNQSLQLIGGVTSTNTTNITTNTTNIATNTTNIATNTASIAAHEAAWTTYTPVITASSGTFTTVVGAGRYLKIGKTVLLSITITITTNGTAATAIIATLPFTCGSGNFVLAGREDAVSGKMVQAKIVASGTSLTVFNYDNTYPGASGGSVLISGAYESV